MDGDSIDVCTNEFTARYDAIDPQVEGVVDRVAAIDKHVSRAFEETLARHGLSHGEYKLLLRLVTRSEEHRLAVGELSRMLMLSSGAMTNRLDRLEKAGFIRRVPDPRDRRGVLVEITPLGETQIDEAVTEQAAKEIELLRTLSSRELNQLNQLLRKVLRSLESDADTTTAAAAG